MINLTEREANVLHARVSLKVICSKPLNNSRCFTKSSLCLCLCFVPRGSAMRTSEFDSSSEEEEVGEEQLTPLHISW